MRGGIPSSFCTSLYEVNRAEGDDVVAPGQVLDAFHLNFDVVYNVYYARGRWKIYMITPGEKRERINVLMSSTFLDLFPIDVVTL